MYVIECITDGVTYPLLNLRNPAHVVADPKLTMGANRTGTLEFTIYPNHPNFNHIDVMSSRIKVYWIRNGKTWLYTGRPVTRQKDFYLTGHLVCEGALSYLLDTRVRPYSYSGTVADFIDYHIDNHNAEARTGEEITVRSVDVIDSNNYITRASSDYPTTLDELMNKGPALLGGYMRLEEVSGALNFDYLTYLPHNSQEIRFGKNLLDLMSKETGDSLFTALIPLGADDTEQAQVAGVNNRVKILHYCPSSEPDDWATRYTDYCTLVDGEYVFVTGDTAPTWASGTYYYGYDYVYDPDLVNTYGLIIGKEEWDDVTLQSNLFNKAKAVLEDLTIKRQITVTAIDLSLTDDEISAFRPGMVTVLSNPHLDGSVEMMLSEMTIDMLQPQNSTFTIGAEVKTYTAGSSKKMTAIEKRIEQERTYMDQLKKEIENAQGLYSTTVTQEDQSVIMYWHDQPDMNDSDMIMQVSSAGVHLTSNGGSSWYGIDFDGLTILQMLYVIGINADYITAGHLAADRVTAGNLTAGSVGGWTIGTNRIYRNVTLTVDNVEYVYQVALQSANDDSGTNNFLYVRRYPSSQSEPSSASGWEYLSRLDKYGGVITSRLRARPSLQSGRANITPSAANTPTSVAITFEEEMNDIPHVIATIATNVPGTAALGVGVTDISTTGFNLWITCTSTTARTVFWLAHTDSANYSASS